jgi:hypothetical protein
MTTLLQNLMVFGLGHFILSALAIFACGIPARGDELQDRMAYWRSQAFHCKEVSGISFPSKERVPDADNTSSCDDGDMTLFNGLLCAVGEDEGCVGVMRSQGGDGRWWRSPRLIGREAKASNDQVSFSPDQALGVLLYVTKTQTKVAFQNWTAWLMSHRPCLVEFPRGNCILKGWPRYCPDDLYTKGCTFRLIDCADLDVSGKFLNAPSGSVCKEVLQTFHIDVQKIKDFLYPTELLALGAAAVNEPDYPLHLAAVEIFLMKQLGDSSPYIKDGGVLLANRDNGNPFFLYLSEGPSAQVRSLVLSECPSPGAPPTKKRQWSWERPSSDKPWNESMYWDCIFIGRLLGAQ